MALRDGGRYLGTGVCVITKDPDSDWINMGTYRVMIHDKNHTGLYISPGKHGRIHRDKAFEKNEPLCMLFPVPHAALETIEPEILDLDDNPDLKAQTMAWKQRRDEFMKKFYAKDPMTLKEAWQRFYFIGKMPDGSSPPRHVHKLRLDVPVDKRKKPAAKP